MGLNEKSTGQINLRKSAKTNNSFWNANPQNRINIFEINSYEQ